MLSGARETVYGHGLASGTTVGAGGSAFVGSGASNISTTVASGGFETVTSGGSAGFLTVSSGGTEQILAAGGEVTNATLLSGGMIDLPYLTFGTGGTISVGSGGLLTVDQGGTVYTQQFSPFFAGQQFDVTRDTSSGTLLTAEQTVRCFLAGTLILMDRGEVAVEALRPGDRVRAQIGGFDAPIVWIGHRAIDCAVHPRPDGVWPVRIAAGAFGDGLPARDLLLSPDHAVFVDGMLIPVHLLIDGGAVSRCPMPRVTWYHIELEQHDVVLAEGLPVETYLAARDTLVGFGSGRPDRTPREWEARGCAPLIVTGPRLAAARARLARVGGGQTAVA